MGLAMTMTSAASHSGYTSSMSSRCTHAPPPRVWQYSHPRQPRMSMRATSSTSTSCLASRVPWANAATMAAVPPFLRADPFSASTFIVLTPSRW